MSKAVEVPDITAQRCESGHVDDLSSPETSMTSSVQPDAHTRRYDRQLRCVVQYDPAFS